MYHREWFVVVKQNRSWILNRNNRFAIHLSVVLTFISVRPSVMSGPNLLRDQVY